MIHSGPDNAVISLPPQKELLMATSSPEASPSLLSEDRLKYAYFRLYMPKAIRQEIGNRLGINAGESGGSKLSDETLQVELETARERTLTKLRTLGINDFEEYDHIHDAFAAGDVERLKILILATQQRLITAMGEIDPTHVRTTKELHSDHEGNYTPEWVTRHQEIVDTAIKEVEPEEIPTLLIIGGPPGSGKTAAREILQEDFGKCVVADPDELRRDIDPQYDGSNYLHTLTTQEEVFYLSGAILDAAFDTSRSVIIEGTMRNRVWLEKEIRRFAAKGYRIQLAWIQRPPEDCFAVATAYRERGVPPELILGAMQDGLPNFYTLAQLAYVSDARFFYNGPEGIDIIWQRLADGTIMESEHYLQIKALIERFARIM